MKNQNKGFIVPLLIAIIAILIIGGGVYIYENKKPEVPVVTNVVEAQPSNQVEATDTQNMPTISSVNIQNCGEVVNAPSSDVTQQQKNTAVYACMSHAIITCSQATIVTPLPSGTGKKTFEILGNSGNYCSISQSIDIPTSKMTCSIPSDFITATNQFLESKNQSGMLFYGIPFFFVPSSTPLSERPVIKNPQTGETVTAQCVDN